VSTVAPDVASARAELDADYTPQFIRVARAVRMRITDGTYPRLSLVPGSRVLAAEFRISPEVVRHGLTVLGRVPAPRRVQAPSGGLGRRPGHRRGRGTAAHPFG